MKHLPTLRTIKPISKKNLCCFAHVRRGLTTGICHMASISPGKQIFVDSTTSDYEIVFDKKG